MSQQNLSLFDEMNRYSHWDAEWRSEVVYEPPRRTEGNNWEKFHAVRDCGSSNVRYVESSKGSVSDEKYMFNLRCVSCGYRVEEEDVLFIGGDWFAERGWKHYGRPLDDLFIQPERILELGPNPDRSELVRLLKLRRIEREGTGLTGFAFGQGTTYECDSCSEEVPLTYDGNCRMCYDGEWTDEMTSQVSTLARVVREYNNSFVHRLPTKVDPFEPGESILPGTLLWRRGADIPMPKIVEVTQRLYDKESDEEYFRLRDPVDDWSGIYHEDTIAGSFWDMNLDYDGELPIHDERVSSLWETL